MLMMNICRPNYLSLIWDLILFIFITGNILIAFIAPKNALSFSLQPKVQTRNKIFFSLFLFIFFLLLTSDIQKMFLHQMETFIFPHKFVFHVYLSIFLAFFSFDQNFLPSAVFVPSTLEDVQIRNKKENTFLFASRNPENQKRKQRRKETWKKSLK